MELKPEFVFLIAVTVVQAALAVDSWVHRRERASAKLRSETVGPASLSARIDAAERMHGQRDEHIQTELGDVRREIDDARRKASDDERVYQRTLGRVNERLARIEERIRISRSIDDREDS